MARIPKLDSAGRFLAADVNAQIDARAVAATDDIHGVASADGARLLDRRARNDEIGAVPGSVGVQEARLAGQPLARQLGARVTLGDPLRLPLAHRLVRGVHPHHVVEPRGERRLSGAHALDDEHPSVRRHVDGPRATPLLPRHLHI